MDNKRQKNKEKRNIGKKKKIIEKHSINLINEYKKEDSYKRISTLR